MHLLSVSAAEIVQQNGDTSLHNNGNDSFMVINSDSPNGNDGDPTYQLDESFIFGSLVQLPVDDLVNKVKGLSDENQKLKGMTHWCLVVCVSHRINFFISR